MVYEKDSYVPCAKIVDGQKFSIISDYLGRPLQSFDKEGKIVWSTTYDIYGNLQDLRGERNFIPFRQLGQYEDFELDGLYYNRFRYYDNESGNYISQDPIGLKSNNPNDYAFAFDSNKWVDIFGLNPVHTTFPSGNLHPGTVSSKNPTGTFEITPTGYHHGDKVALYGEAGLKEGFDASKWTSHHVSYDPKTNKMTMQLVATDVHSKTNHIGGVKDFEGVHDVKYNTESARLKAESYK